MNYIKAKKLLLKHYKKKLVFEEKEGEGKVNLVAKGVKFGAKPKEKPAEYEGLAEAWRRGEVSARKAAEQLHVSHPTFLRWVKQQD